VGFLSVPEATVEAQEGVAILSDVEKRKWK